MEFESILVSKALPDREFRKNPIIDAHRYMTPACAGCHRTPPLLHFFSAAAGCHPNVPKTGLLNSQNQISPPIASG
jgi:hypothetical protein